jgi:hypothetical protein
MTLLILLRKLQAHICIIYFKSMHQIELKKSIITLMDNGILHIHLKAGAEIQLSDAVLIVDAMGKIGKGKKFPILIDAGEFTSVDKEVRTFAASEESNIYTLADAIAYYSYAQKLIADFYIKHDHPVVPTRAFATKEEAIQWLETFQNGV